MNDSYNWAAQFGEIFVSCCEEYEDDNKDYLAWFDDEDLEFLKSIGCKARELFDFVEDCCSGDNVEPTPETALLIASARRDYFLVEQKGQWSARVIKPSELPSKTAELEGIVWLPRIIAKAEAKLRGEMDEDTMYGCGGDRAFLSRHHLHPADFLRVVWAARGNESKILSFVNSGKYH